jgi:hypothetical protein
MCGRVVAVFNKRLSHMLERLVIASLPGNTVFLGLMKERLLQACFTLKVFCGQKIYYYEEIGEEKSFLYQII